MRSLILLCVLIVSAGFSACSTSSKGDQGPPPAVIGQGPPHALAPPVPLRTSGRYIVDADGDRVKLASVNWYGASDEHFVVDGLDHAHIDEIAKTIRALGMNSVRLPFANKMLHITEPVDPAYIAANPQLIGMTPLQVFDETINALAREGLLIILNNHTTNGMWCGRSDVVGEHHPLSRRWRFRLCLLAA